MGFMGHMSLIAEEVVKLFLHYPEAIAQTVQRSIPQPDWDRYVETTLRETRDRDLQPLGGGISAVAHDSISTASGLSDEDDEFPTYGYGGSRILRSLGDIMPSSPGAVATASTSTAEDSPFGSIPKLGESSAGAVTSGVVESPATDQVRTSTSTPL